MKNDSKFDQMVLGSKKHMIDRNAIVTAAMSNVLHRTPNDLEVVVSTDRSNEQMHHLNNIRVDRIS